MKSITAKQYKELVSLLAQDGYKLTVAELKQDIEDKENDGFGEIDYEYARDLILNHDFY